MYLIQHVNISVIVLAGGIKLSEFKVLSILSIGPLPIYRLLVPSRTLLCTLESNRLPTRDVGKCCILSYLSTWGTITGPLMSLIHLTINGGYCGLMLGVLPTTDNLYHCVVHEIFIWCRSWLNLNFLYVNSPQGLAPVLQIPIVPSRGTLKLPAQPGQLFPQPLPAPAVLCGTWPDSELQFPPVETNVWVVNCLKFQNIFIFIKQSYLNKM